LRELTDIRNFSDVVWLIGGDFNVVRNKQERKERSYNHSISTKFNSFININHLLDLRPQDRLYTWSNLREYPSLACLDRFLCTLSWEREFPNCINKSLPRYQSDHNTIILLTNNSITLDNTIPIRYDKTWTHQEGFNELLISWWISYELDTLDLGKSWKDKMQHMRRKFRGWNNNIKEKVKRDKLNLLNIINELELIQEERDMNTEEFNVWEESKIKLDNIYTDEELYWQQRSNLQWILEGDDTKFFHLLANNRRRKKSIFFSFNK
jgi:hypothetical protein